MNAWLITWEGTRKISEVNKIVGVISGKCSESHIEKLVDFLYHQTKFNVHEMTFFANKRKKREHQSKTVFSRFGYISYGNNPFLYARQVKDFIVKYDDEKEVENISWVELAVYGNDEKDDFKIKELEPEKKKSITRPKYQPIAEVPYDA